MAKLVPFLNGPLIDLQNQHLVSLSLWQGAAICHCLQRGKPYATTEDS